MDAIVFTGAGDRSFSAGVHVDAFLDLTPRSARELIRDLKALPEAIRQALIPTVCAVNGYCLGGAMELAMVCDVRVAARSARFGMPEIKVGIPSVLDAALLQQHVGLSRAKEMLLTGDLYGAETLEQWGFELNSRLILVRDSGYGQAGPYKDRPGFANIGEVKYLREGG